MRKVLLLAGLAMAAIMMFVPVALAQDDKTCDDYTILASAPARCIPSTNSLYVGGGQGGTIMETTMVNGSPVPVPVPTTGGPAILLPAASLLLGSGILTYAVLRRR